jgi:hypothetical protein
MMRSRRGQAAVELCLGLLVFVTVLLFAVHFGEAGTLLLKVDEAATSALWDTTAAPMHELPGRFKPARTAIASAGRNAQLRYADLDGRTSTSEGTRSTLALTRVENVQVRCVESAPPAARFALKSLSAIYGGSPGGMQCSASADLEALRVPRDLAEGEDGFFAAVHSERPSFSVCATGSCKGRYELLLDDWGLAGASASQECPLGNCPNTQYQQSVHTLFDAYGGSQGRAGSALAMLIVGRTPFDEARFFMSFRGEESRFIEWALPDGEGARLFPTSPGDLGLVLPLAGNQLRYHDAYRARTECFLGRGC